MPTVRSSVKPSIAETNILSREDARQITENVTGFFSILAKWSRAELAEPANDTDKPDEADNGGELRHDR